jgi:hypothetical protein
MGPTEYRDITALTITEPPPRRGSLFESGIPDLVFPSYELVLKEQLEGYVTVSSCLTSRLYGRDTSV